MESVIDERKFADATPAAIELALVMSRPELEDLRSRMKALHESAEWVPLPTAK